MGVERQIDGTRSMIRNFTAAITREDKWIVAQCIEIDVASQGRTEAEAMRNLREAIALHFEAPVATTTPKLRPLEVETVA
jgi:predicted RNase H-like HicB family nuclease